MLLSCPKTRIRILLRQGYAFFIWALLPLVLPAQNHYQYTPAHIEAYRSLMRLDLDRGMEQIHRLEAGAPQNLVSHHLRSYHGFFAAYTDDQESSFKENKKIRDEALKALQQGPDDSPWHLFLQADVRLQWALLRFRHGEYFAGFWEVKRAYNLLEKNRDRFPDFAPNYKDLGILHALVGTVPDTYKWGLRLLSGMDGTIRQGKNELQRALRDDTPATRFLRAETTMLYSFLLLYLDKDTQEAWRGVQKPVLDPQSELLHAYTYAYVANRSGKNPEALQTLQQARRDPNWERFPYLEFLLGEVKLQQLDLSAADHYRTYLRRYRGTDNIKACHFRLAWIAVLRDNLPQYREAIASVLAQGAAESGRDRDALYFAQLNIVPHPALIKARLLFDGGAYTRALQALEPYREEDFPTIYEQLEWTYRMARICHQLKLTDRATHFYESVLLRGQDQPYYFAGNAALQLGLIHEDRKDREKAAFYFEKCLDLKPEVYRNSLHLAAKAGLQRLKE